MGQTQQRQQYQGQLHSQPEVYVSPYSVPSHIVPQYRHQANQPWQEQSEYQSQYQGQQTGQHGQHAMQQGQQQAEQQGQQQAEQQGQQQARQAEQEQEQEQAGQQRQQAVQQGEQQAVQQGQQQARQQGQQQTRQQEQQQARQQGQQHSGQSYQQYSTQPGQYYMPYQPPPYIHQYSESAPSVPGQNFQNNNTVQTSDPQRGCYSSGQHSFQPSMGQTYHRQRYPVQSYSKLQMFTLRYPLPPQTADQQYQQQAILSGQPYAHQSEPPRQSYQAGQQQSGQQQSGQPYLQYSAPTGQQPYYIQPQPAMNQNVPYRQQYFVPPPSAQGSSMVRPGRRPHQEVEPVGWRGFQDKYVRAVFIRKVYTILMIQLLFTLGVIALFVFEPHVKRFVQENKYLYYISLAVFVAVYLGMACFQSVRRHFPMNIIVLTAFTLAMSYMLGTISSYHTTEGVFMAVGICAAVCLLVSVFSFYTKFDFTSCGGILCILLLVLILFGLIAIFLPSRIMTIIYASAGAVIFTLFLAYDTQMMMGGKKYELSPEEHIFAAVQLYVDIVYIFMFLLMLLGGRE